MNGARGAVAAVVVALGAIAGCTNTVFLSKGDDRSTELATDPCKEKSCGESCLFDACSGQGGGSSVTCDAQAAAGACDASGQCTLAEPVCTPWIPCDAKSSTCGDSCWPCDPTSSACSPPGNVYTCTDALKCLPGKADCSCVGVDCPTPQPCAGLGCGDPCNCDPQLNAHCVETSSPTFCDGNGKCLPVEQIGCPSGYQPCENKVCGQTCSLCKPGDKNCKDTIELTCDASLECTLPPVACQIPCTPARCGMPCLPCDPSSPGCVPPPNTFCDPYGSCSVGDAPMCPCKGLGCGDACTICAPDGTCTADMRSCDVDGACVPSVVPLVCH